MAPKGSTKITLPFPKNNLAGAPSSERKVLSGLNPPHTDPLGDFSLARISPSIKFIDGVPIKEATNLVFGF